MSEVPAPPPVASAAERRSTDLALARLHLRLGSLALARTEFEALAGRGGLDDEALVDLAEARWRTGESGRAGEAATAALDHGSDSPLAVMIAAEAAFALGRPGEARRLATRAMTKAGGTLDALFAGMPRSSVWPSDPADPAPSETTLFGEDRLDPSAGASEEGARGRRLAPDAAIGAVALSDATTPGLWDVDEVTHEVPASPDPATLMEAGLAALDAGDADRAAALLGLAIRTGPHLAPVILDGTIDATHPSLLLVRGDAFRSTGQEREAAEAYVAAARALGEDSTHAPAAPDADQADPDRADPDTALQSGPTSPTPQ